MSMVAAEEKGWLRVPVAARAIASGLLVGLVAANVWPLLLIGFGMPAAAFLEAGFLALYLWWARGGGVPASLREERSFAFRSGNLTRAQWLVGLAVALSFALTVHAAMVVLFRLVPFPAEAFHRDYNFGMTLGPPLKWVAIVLSAASAGICEETGFRGYMQRPLEKRHGSVVAISVSSVLFAIIHLSKSWAILEMFPLVLGAGVLLGLMAWAGNSLIPGIIAHTIMDIGMFGYWWTGTAGTFSARTTAATGIDAPFAIAFAVMMTALVVTLALIMKLRRLVFA